MAGRFDDTLKHLTEVSPLDWVLRGGWSAPAATVVDADIATIAGAVDKVICVTGPPDWLLAVDFHAGHDSVAKLPDLLLYNSALFRRHRLPVHSLLVVLHRGADSPQLTGLYERGVPGEPPDVTLRYRVLRVWEVPAEQWLSGGIGLVPLAPLGAVSRQRLPAVVAAVKERLKRDVPPPVATDLLSATYILMGLRYERALIERLLQGVHTMKESVTYQAILQEGEARGKALGEAHGRAAEARQILLLLGRDRFGEPSAEERVVLDRLTDVHTLEQLVVQVTRAASWQALLASPAPPAPRRRSPRRKTSS